MHHLKPKDRGAFILAFLLPALIMGVYFFAVRHVYPFGNASLLTVDMGQQYIDFYAYFRDTVANGHFGQLFYGWNNALGGDMSGTWAYYLYSPFNFLLLLFPANRLDFAITLMTLAKYAAAGGAMAAYLRGRHLHGGLIPAFSTAYALNGWFIANQLNLMWFDGVIFLPLVALAIDRLGQKRWRAYPIWLTLTIITNYYIGFMVCLFTCCYFAYTLSRDWTNRHDFWRRVRRFIAGGILSAGMSAVVLFPTLFQILQSKGTYTVNQIHARIEYPPLHLLSKLFAGAYNFDQMPEGLPNFFVGGLVMLGVLIFFSQHKIAWRERLTALSILLFLTLSLMFEPLDLLWHGMQFPVWYPYRFSFVFSFFLIVLAVRGIQVQNYGVKLAPMLLLTAIILGITLYIWHELDAFNYLSPTSLALTTIYALLALTLLSVDNTNHQITGWLITLLAVLEMSTNAAMSLNQISYVSHSDYHTYTESLRTAVDKVTAYDTDTYRIGKTVLRTKNDAMQLSYMGEDQFNSMLIPALPRFFAALGQPEGDGFVAYTNGTQVTDAVLGTKYWISPRPVTSSTLGNTLLPTSSTRPDLSEYTRIDQTPLLNVSQNHNALRLGFAASPAIFNTPRFAGTPLANQAQMFNALTGHLDTTLFTPVPLTLTKTTNAVRDTSVAGIHYTPKAKNQDAILTYSFTPVTGQPLYLTVGAAFTDNAVDVRVNGQKIVTYDTFRNLVVLNVTPGQMNAKQTLTLRFKKQIDLSVFTLSRLEKDQLTAGIATLKQHQLHHITRTGNSLSGKFTTTATHPNLFLSIPNSAGWHIKVDGKKVKAKTVFGLLMGIKTPPGHHDLKMTYWPPYLGLGLLLSLISLTIIWCLKPKAPQHAKPRR